MDDYISRKSFIEDIKTEILNLSMDGLKGTPRPHDELYGFIERIEEQPSADVRPVVRGRWGDDDCCTNCGEEADYNWERGIHYYSNFCPNCGADMREEQNETDLV